METVTGLTAVAGAILAIALEYVPYVKDWYNERSPDAKKQIVGLLLIIAACGSFIAGCYSPFGVAECSEAGAWELVAGVGLALLAGTATNQTTHALTKRTK